MIIYQVSDMMYAGKTAAEVARQVLRLPDDKTLWTQEQKSQYLATYADILRANPEETGGEAAANNYESASAVQDEKFSLLGATWDALGESVAELPGRVSGAIDTVGEGIWNAFPSWSKWLAGSVVVIGSIVAVLVWLPGARQVASASASRAADRIARKRPRKK
ncbi:hypothetical protein OpiT1DRAFT_01244 [Opitutaceae bacterium TAV1]|nr:hypothetical protein OpiT1DRAFT_01244 [Opitutaceae bacterium TAV1]